MAREFNQKPSASSVAGASVSQSKAPSKSTLEASAVANPYSGSPGGIKIGTVTSMNGSPLVVGASADTIRDGRTGAPCSVRCERASRLRTA